MNEQTSKERVLKVYPNAYAEPHQNGGWRVFKCKPYMGYEVVGHAYSGTEAEAWDDAASRLPETKLPSSPAGETASAMSRYEGLDILGNPIFAVPEPLGDISGPKGSGGAAPEGDYSCATCGMFMQEPCEHWKRMLSQPDPEAAAVSVGKSNAELDAEKKIRQKAVIDEYAGRALAKLQESAAPIAPAAQDGISLIATERARQISEEGWSAEHDDEHDGNQIAMAAACYASPVPLRAKTEVPCGCRSAECPHSMFGKQAWVDAWPWEPAWDKRNKHDRLRQLAIAGALIAAEIDRLQRLARAERKEGEAKHG